jgi:hypothetical protein
MVLPVGEAMASSLCAFLLLTQVCAGDSGLNDSADMQKQILAVQQPNALISILGQLDNMLSDIQHMKPPAKPTMDHNIMSVCTPYTPWFIFLLSLLGLALLSILTEVFFTIDKVLKEEDDPTALNTQGKLSSPRGTGWQSRPIGCQFLRVRRSLSNWKSQGASPPPPAKHLDENGLDLPINAKLRHLYVFRLKHLLNPRRLRKTVLGSGHIWKKTIPHCTTSEYRPKEMPAPRALDMLRKVRDTSRLAIHHCNPVR